MKYLAVWMLILGVLVVPTSAQAATLTSIVSGRVLLDVDDHGATWYVEPVGVTRHSLKSSADALGLVRTYGLGISDKNLASIPEAGSSSAGDLTLRRRLAGRLLLAVESHGEAWYVHPVDLKRYKLGNDGLRVLQSLALGIHHDQLIKISTGATPVMVSSSVPFAAQSPFGGWSDARETDGCEEAVALMANAWVRGSGLDLAYARDQIHAMSDWEKVQFGYFEDTGAQDTADRLLIDYLSLSKIEVRFDISTTDIRQAIEAGALVVVPIDGTKIGNIHYRHGGPTRHMILIVGYDPAADEFIAHDPGTIYGANYRYSGSTLQNSLRDYPSGVHQTVIDQQTAMIVINK